MYRIPDNIEIYVEVAMDEAVAERDDFGPWHLSILLAELGRQACRGLSHDFKQVDERKAQSFIGVGLSS
ncbi:MAG: hypothetical protein ABFD96_12815 [Armatimonadia bacterium]